MRHPYLIFLVFLFLSLAHTAYSLRIALSPIKVDGSYRATIGEKESRIVKACYLGKQKLEVISDEQADEEEGEEGDAKQVTICDVVPVPLLNTNSVFPLFSSNGILERDKGLFDNLPYEVWSQSKMTKKMLYDTCLSLGRSKGSTNNAYTTFLEAVEKVLDAQMTGLLLEVKDASDANVLLGGAVVVAKRSFSDKHRLTASSSLRDADPNEMAVCNIHLDELVNLALATSMPIFIDQKLYLSTCIDALLTQTSSSGLAITSMPPRLSNNKRRSKPTMRDYPTKAWDIKDPEVYLQLSTSEKRSILHLSGVLELPRPREGKQALDAMLLDLCDAAVRSEVNRRMGSKGNKETSGQGGNEGGDGRAALLQKIASALEAQDVGLASQLRADFDLKTSLRADPTQQTGSYDRYLDQDEWYMQQRRIAMAPKKKNS